MVFLRVVNYNVPENSTVMYTSWQISKNKDFDDSQLILNNENDPIHLYNFYTNVELNQGEVYYSRCRMTLTTGITDWSNVEMTVVDNVNESEQLLRFSTPIQAPVITMLFENESQPRGYVKAHIDRFIVDNNVHAYTSWVLENVDGEAIFVSKKDSLNVTDIIIPVLLDVNSVYVLKAKIHMITEDSSTYGVKVIKTVPNDGYNNCGPSVHPIYEGGDYNIVPRDVPNTDKMEVQVYLDGILQYSKVMAATVQVTIRDVISESNTSVDDFTNRFFIIRVRMIGDTIVDDWGYCFHRLYTEQYILPAQFPYNFAHQFTWEHSDDETLINNLIDTQPTRQYDDILPYYKK